jgi:hypothetical protein
MVLQNLVLFGHCLAQQCRHGGVSCSFTFRSSFQALDGFFLFSIVFRFDRQLNYAALTINADDLGFYFLAFFQNVARVFNAVTADFG